MTSITIRKLDEELAQWLCIRAAKHGCSMEEEARNILRTALEQETAPTEALGTALHAIFKPLISYPFVQILIDNFCAIP